MKTNKPVICRVFILLFCMLFLAGLIPHDIPAEILPQSTSLQEQIASTTESVVASPQTSAQDTGNHSADSFASAPPSVPSENATQTTGSTSEETLPQTLEEATATAPFAGDLASTVTGKWPGGATHLADAKGGASYTISYSVFLNTDTQKYVEVIVPSTMIVDRVPAVAAPITSVDQIAVPEGKKLRIGFGTFAGTASFSISVSLSASKIYSQENLSISSTVTAGTVTSEPTFVTLTVYDYTQTATVFLPKVLSPADTIYDGYKTSMSLWYNNSVSGQTTLLNSGIAETNCAITIDAGKYFYVKTTSDTVFRPILATEIDIDDSSDASFSCTFNKTTMQLTLTAQKLDYGINIPFSATFHLAPGSQLRIGGNVTGDASAVSYENSFTTQPTAKHTKFEFRRADTYPFTVREYSLQADIQITAPLMSRNYPYLISGKANQQLFAVGAAAVSGNLQNLRFTINIPAKVTVTHIFMQTAAAAYGGTITIYSDENNTNPQTVTCKNNAAIALQPIVGPASFVVEIPQLNTVNGTAQQLPIGGGASNLIYRNRFFRFFGTADVSNGQQLAFSLGSNITASNPEQPDTKIKVSNSSQAALQTFTTTATEAVYRDASVAWNLLLDADKKAMAYTNNNINLRSGSTYYWGMSVAPQRTYSYCSVQNDFNAPAVYFSVPSYLLPVSGEFTSADIYSTLKRSGGTAEAYTGEIRVETLQTSNYNGGETVVMVTAPTLELNYNTNKGSALESYLNGPLDEWTVYLRFKVDDEIFSSTEILLANTGQLVTTAAPEALNAGYVNSGNSTAILKSNSLFKSMNDGISGDKRLLYNNANVASQRKLTIVPLTSATMSCTLKPSFGTTFISYDPNNPQTAPTMQAGNYGEYKLTMLNGTDETIANPTGYFITPYKTNLWNAQITGAPAPTSGSVTQGVHIYYSTVAGLNGSSLLTDDSAGNWVPAEQTSTYNNITAIKVVADSLQSGQRYSATLPFAISAVNGEAACYGIAAGSTSYRFGTTIVQQGTTAAVQLAKSNPPEIVPADVGYDSAETLVIEYGENITTVNQNILTANVTDDVTGNTLLTHDDLPMELDLENSTVAFDSGEAVPFQTYIANGTAPINSKKPGTYTIVYKSLADHDRQTSTVTRTIVVLSPNNYAYTVAYYIDTLKATPDYTSEGWQYPEDTQITPALVAEDLGDNWLDLYRPEDYESGSVQGSYPIISRVTENNIIQVLYIASPGQAEIEALQRSAPAYDPDLGATVVSPGQEVTYYIDVANVGSKRSNEIIISNAIPTGTGYVDGSAGSTDSSTTVSLEDGKLVFTFPSGIAKNNKATVYFKVTAPSEVVQTFFENTATMSIDGSTITTNTVRHMALSTVPGRLSSQKAANPASGSYVQPEYGGVPGSTITYTITATNVGGNAVENAVIEDAIPAGTAYVEGSASMQIDGAEVANATEYANGKLVWTANTVAPASVVTCSFQVTVGPLPTGVNLQNYENAATVNDEPTNLVSHTALSLEPGRLAAEKTANPAPGSYVQPEYGGIPGSIITYTITATNVGGNAVENTVIEDAIPAGTAYVEGSASMQIDGAEVANAAEYSNGKLLWKASTVAPASIVTCSFQVAVGSLPTGINLQNYENTATVNDEPTNLVTHTALSLEPGRLAAEKTASPASGSYVQPEYGGAPGSTITYTITAKNVGGNEVENAVFEDSIPAGTTYVAGSASMQIDGDEVENAAEYTDGKLVWTANTIVPESVVTCSFQVTVNPLPTGVYAQNYENFATVNDVPTNLVSHTALSLEPGRLAAEKTANPASGSYVQPEYGGVPGSTITYTITATNVGGNAVENAVFEDSIPAGTTYVAGSASMQIDGAEVANAAEYTNGKLVWAANTVAPASVVTCSFQVTVGPLPNGVFLQNYENTALVNNEPTNLVTHTALSLEPGRLAAEKTASPASGSYVQPEYGGMPGSTITYTITATNVGGNTVENAVIEDTIPAGTTYVQGSASMQIDGAEVANAAKYTNGKLVWRANTVAPAGVVTCSFQVTVGPLPNGVYTQTYENVATVDDKPTNAVSHTAAAFAKRTSAQTVREGDLIQYTFQGIGNPTGKATNNFILEDNPGKGLEPVSATLPAFFESRGVQYAILYKTSKNSNLWVTLESGIEAEHAHTCVFPQLAAGEQYIGIRFSFGTVPANFALGNSMSLTFRAQSGAPANILVNSGNLLFGAISLPALSPDKPTFIPGTPSSSSSSSSEPSSTSSSSSTSGSSSSEPSGSSSSASSDVAGSTSAGPSSSSGKTGSSSSSKGASSRSSSASSATSSKGASSTTSTASALPSSSSAQNSKVQSSTSSSASSASNSSTDAAERGKTLEALKNAGVPIIKLGSLQIPCWGISGYEVWGATNLLLAAVNLLFGLMLFIVKAKQKQAGSKGRNMKIATTVLSATTVLLFLATQNLARLMVLLDILTPVFAVLVAAQVCVFIFWKRGKNVDIPK